MQWSSPLTHGTQQLRARPSSSNFWPLGGHCKRMKPAWDRLAEEFADHKTTGIFDVDCTAEGKPLCDANGVRGFPTIKHGDPNNLEDYNGGRDYDDLKAFADGLKPSCSPAQRDLCDEEQLAQIDKYTEMGKDAIESFIADGEKAIEDAEANFKSEVEKLQSKYESLMAEKDAAIAAVKAAGQGMAKSVLASLD